MTIMNNMTALAPSDLKGWIEDALSAHLRESWFDRFGANRIICRGRCQPSVSLREYRGCYIGKLLDDSFDVSKTIGIPLWYPKALHEKLMSLTGVSLSLKGRFVFGRSRQGIGIEARFELDDILAVNDSNALRQGQAKLTQAENRFIARRQLKNKGLSLVSLVEQKLDDYFIHGRPLVIQILRPETSRITDDVRAALTTSQSAFVIREVRFHAGNPVSVAEKIREYGSAADVDFLCVVRGGGKEQIAEVFNAPIVLDALSCASLSVVAAIGHYDDVTLFHKYADESFHTPTALGAWLNGKYEEAKERTERMLNVSEENARLKEQIERLQASQKKNALDDAQTKDPLSSGDNRLETFRHDTADIPPIARLDDRAEHKAHWYRKCGYSLVPLAAALLTVLTLGLGILCV